jgi:predicted DNA-binding protein YlxM (UPF0122 family)
MRTKLQIAINESGYSVQEIATQISTHRSAIYNHLKCRANLGSRKAIALAKLLDIPLDDVYI